MTPPNSNESSSRDSETPAPAGSSPADNATDNTSLSTELHAEVGRVEAADIPADDPGRPRMVKGPRVEAAPGNSRAVEVLFKPSGSQIAANLAAGVEGFVEAVAAGAAGPEASAIQDILLYHNLQGSSTSFSTEHIQADNERLVQIAATGNVAADTLAGQPPLQNVIRLEFATAADAAAAKQQLDALPVVAVASVVHDAAPPDIPNDPLIGVSGSAVPQDPSTGLEPQWYLHRTGVLEAWALGARGQNVVIADIDWGYRVTHQDLKPRLEMANAYNSYDGSQNVSYGSYVSHGTGVLGIAGAAANGTGIAGYAPAAALWPIQANRGPGPRISTASWADAIEWVRLANSGGRHKVIIFEAQTDPAYGNYEQIPSVNLAIRRAIADNVVVCVAAGNGDLPADMADDGVTPIEPTGSILVGATKWDPNVEQRASFSNWGSRIVVSAPGDDQHDVTCTSTSDITYTNRFGGTSGATPKVAGVVALMLSVNPNLSHHDVREILRGTGDEITPEPSAPGEPDKRIGVFLNAEAAVREALRRAGFDATGDQATAAPGRIEGLCRQSPRRKRRSSEEQSQQRAATRDGGGDRTGVGPVAIPAAPPLPPPLDRTLREFRESTQGLMTREQQLLVINQAIHLLDLFYVHRPLKESMHAVRPIQRLRVLRRRLEEEPQTWMAREELCFHNFMTEIFTSMRDLHTNYLLPQPYRDYTTFLPFLVRPYHDEKGRHYIVTHVVPDFKFTDTHFGPGVEVLSWNGMEIETAVELSAQQTAGSNLAARYARGIDALTLRPMNVALPPEANWVYVGFRDDHSYEAELRQNWLVRFTPLEDANAVSNSIFNPAAANLRPAAGPATPVATNISIAEEMAFSTNFTAVEYESKQELIFNQPQGVAAAANPNGALDNGPIADGAVGDAATVGGAAPPDMTGVAATATAATPTTATPTAATATPTAGPVTAGPVTAGPATTQYGSDLPSVEYLAALGMDVAADAVREVKHLIFRPDTVSAATEQARTGAAPPTPASDVAQKVPSQMPLVFEARRVTVNGRQRAYIRILTFLVRDPDVFVNEFIRLVEQLPQDGLLLDVRGNGGGNIYAAERLLQTLTPARIEPERLQFISTAGTLDLCRRNATVPINLSPWTTSLEQAVLTGATYSQALPITDPDSCNAIGQRYHGPVVLLVDGRCYSATDIFAAGFQDHGIGTIVGTSPHTGAGGANVWGHDLLYRLYSGDGSPLKPLPHRMGMRIAIRQTLRVGPRAGTLLEDFGVSPAPDRIHKTTRRDLQKEDADLIEFAARQFDKQDVYRLRLVHVPQPQEQPQGQVQFRVDHDKVKRLDFYLNGHPANSIVITAGAPLPTFSVKPGTAVEVRGFANGPQGKERCVAATKVVA